ncbi:MAG: hypothetical protein ACLTYN_01950 [Dysosmobacter welbionis]
MARLSGGADGADPGRSENITLRDIRAAGGQREDDQTLLSGPGPWKHHPAG